MTTMTITMTTRTTITILITTRNHQYNKKVDLDQRLILVSDLDQVLKISSV